MIMFGFIALMFCTLFNRKKKKEKKNVSAAPDVCLFLVGFTAHRRSESYSAENALGIVN